jgi:hypothetical protein
MDWLRSVGMRGIAVANPRHSNAGERVDGSRIAPFWNRTLPRVISEAAAGEGCVSGLVIQTEGLCTVKDGCRIAGDGVRRERQTGILISSRMQTGICSHSNS